MSFGVLVCEVVNHRNHKQRKDGRGGNTEYDCPSQTVKKLGLT